jgi:prepilin-type N-terminal cleavage/methylation domain
MKKNEKHARQAGFTLVELLLVVAILGVLAGVAMFSTKGLSTEARINATRASIAAIENAVSVYEIRHGKFPDSFEQLLQSELLPSTARADAFGTPFAYKKSSAKFVEIRSAGPDGQMNNEDDITNAEAK